MVVSYETPSFRRRFLLEGDKVLQGRSFYRKHEKGEVYLAKVNEQVQRLGSLFEIEGETFLCQEKGLRLGEQYLVEIIKRQEGKYPLLSTNPGWISENFIYRPGKGVDFSKEIPESYRDHLLSLDLTDVYFRREALKTPLYRIKDEYDLLRKKIDGITRQMKEDQLEPGLVHEPPFKEEGEKWMKVHLEERILQVRKGKVEEEGIVIYFEPTRVGLVVDVNGVGKEEELNRRAQELIEEILELMNVGGLVLIDLVGSGKGYRGPGTLSREGVLILSRPVRGANLFNVDEDQLKKDYVVLKDKLEETQ